MSKAQDDRPFGFTEREEGIIELLAGGKSIDEIAAEYFYHPRTYPTTRNRVIAMLKKTGARDVDEMLKLWLAVN